MPPFGVMNYTPFDRTVIWGILLCPLVVPTCLVAFLVVYWAWRDRRPATVDRRETRADAPE